MGLHVSPHEGRLDLHVNFKAHCETLIRILNGNLDSADGPSSTLYDCVVSPTNLQPTFIVVVCFPAFCPF